MESFANALRARLTDTEAASQTPQEMQFTYKRHLVQPSGRTGYARCPGTPRVWTRPNWKPLRKGVPLGEIGNNLENSEL
jgi:hypothetical protein